MRIYDYGGEGGIRTHGTVSRTLAFEASTLNRSVTSPRRCNFHRSRAFNFPAMHRQEVCLCLARLAAFCEKLLHHRRTLLSEDAQSNFHLWLRRESDRSWKHVRTAPPLGSSAPYTK